MASIYNQQQFYTDHSSPSADKVILASTLHIGGETQRTLESALQALGNNGGSGSFSALSDVAFENLEDGHRIVYDATSGKWINKEPLKIVTWAGGTDEEIVAMLEAHYNDEIDITDYWTVGDERVVHLNAMSATGVNESHVTQDVRMVLMNVGGKTLVNPINGHSECAFIVGQENMLVNGTRLEGGYMNSSNDNTGGWNNCLRRTWCNSVYKNALPSTLVGIFKEHQNITANGTGSTTVTSNDYFALPSEKEIFGSVTNANATAEANNTQFKYYETSSNRIKYQGEVSGYANSWWERSPSSSGIKRFCRVDNLGSASIGNASSVNNGLAPFGVI